jgi:hypothetical protein
MPTRRYKPRHARPRIRQLRAAHWALAATAFLVLAGLSLSAIELRAAGLAGFLFRPAGTGATRDDVSVPSPAPAPRPVILLVPALRTAPQVTIIIPVSAGEVLSVSPGRTP